jgi:hypothetical protein
MASASSLEILVSHSTSREELIGVNTESRMGICFRFSFFSFAPAVKATLANTS